MPRSLDALALVLLLLPAPLLAQSRTVERGWRLASDGAVRVFNMSGPTRVVGWDRDSVAVTATLAAGERLEGGGAAAGVKMFVDVPDESRPGGTTLVLRVPARARVWVKGAADPVEVGGVTGGLDLYPVGRAIRVSGAPRELRGGSGAR